MKIALNQNLQGLNRAKSQVNLASSRIARWGLNTEGVNDTVAIDGAERPRNVLNQKWGKGPDGLSPDVNLSEEAIRFKSGEWAFKANIAATRSVLDMEREAIERLDAQTKDD
jgi:hypothetical protein